MGKRKNARKRDQVEDIPEDAVFSLSPKGVIVSIVNENTTDLILKDLELHALRNGRNAILIDKGVFKWIEVEWRDDG